MGQTLSSPATQKHSQSGGNGRYFYGISEMQGWRITMEDAHAAVLQLDEGKEEDSNTFFAVYDGHGGGTVARFAGQNVHRRLVSEETYKEKKYDAALKRAFLGTDEDLLANPAHTRDPSGCTAVAALITNDNKIYVANAGDSRSVIGIKGEVKPLSFDHKPTSDVERARISGAGGYIEYGRVNGNLALSRALGDFEFKKNYALSPEAQIITANPDVTCHEITEDDEFLVLACDGIWDCLSSQQAVDFVRYQVAQGKELTEIGEMMCDHCLAPDTTSGAGIGCDNMTVLIVAITHGRTKEEWYAWVKDRVEKKYGYDTPSQVPQLYAQSRLMSFRARREAQEARDRDRVSRSDDDEAGNTFGFLSGSNLGGLARVLGSTGGISFHPGSGIMNDSGSLMFTQDDSDEEDEAEDEGYNGSGRSFFSDTLGLGRPESPDPTKRLKEQLGDFEKDLKHDGMDDDDDSQMSEVEDEHFENPGGEASSTETPGEAPPPPKLPNGDAKSTSPVEQLKSQPGGDAIPPVVKAEGLLDKSEDPLKG
ncbi:PP2C-domain-containing protein [Crucibulum laeve]|uniref:protein-serine/threonine phosphatase n=1 Tax=Crucibulum laeve TaxID=68775 RepID=A0A5C3M554_9AGAR|nr:PP2C-domain-containing protein [Crucibulum laeve]